MVHLILCYGCNPALAWCSLRFHRPQPCRSVVYLFLRCSTDGQGTSITDSYAVLFLNLSPLKDRILGQTLWSKLPPPYKLWQSLLTRNKWSNFDAASSPDPSMALEAFGRKSSGVKQ